MNIFDDDSGPVGFLISIYLVIACSFAAVVTLAAPFSIPWPFNAVAGVFAVLMAGWALHAPKAALSACMTVTPGLLGIAGGGWALAIFVWPSLASAAMYELTVTLVLRQKRHADTLDRPE